MAFKKFSEHSQRWQREKLRDGVNPARWNAWNRLSEKSRKSTTPTAYGQGQSVREQVRAELVDKAATNVVAAQRARGAQRDNGKGIDVAIARKNLGHKDSGLSNPELRKIAGLSRADLIDMIDESLDRSYLEGTRSPFWYNKKG